jgi:hypothetical protein
MNPPTNFNPYKIALQNIVASILSYQKDHEKQLAYIQTQIPKISSGILLKKNLDEILHILKLIDVAASNSKTNKKLIHAHVETTQKQIDAIDMDQTLWGIAIQSLRETTRIVIEQSTMSAQRERLLTELTQIKIDGISLYDWFSTPRGGSITYIARLTSSILHKPAYEKGVEEFRKKTLEFHNQTILLGFPQDANYYAQYQQLAHYVLESLDKIRVYVTKQVREEKRELTPDEQSLLKYAVIMSTSKTYEEVHAKLQAIAVIDHVKI